MINHKLGGLKSHVELMVPAFVRQLGFANIQVNLLNAAIRLWWKDRPMKLSSVGLDCWLQRR